MIGRPLITIGRNMGERSDASSNGKARVLAAEKVIEQLLVLVGWGVQQNEGLKRQLVWLKQPQFGRKSEATQAKGEAGAAEGATESSGSAGAVPALAPGTEPVGAGGVVPRATTPGATAREQRPETATAFGFARTNHPSHPE